MSEISNKYEKYRESLNFIKDYSAAENASTGSRFDPNANVETKNVATLAGEVPKGAMIGINRLRMHDTLKELYDEQTADDYLRGLEAHDYYVNDETSIYPYCVSITMYPFLFKGLTAIGGPSSAPKNLDSFCGSFINLVFAVSSQFAGACSTPELLLYLDYFIRKDYGDDYYTHVDDVVDLSSRRRTIRKVIDDCFEQIVYSLNIPAAARNFQSVFHNIAYFDNPYFDGMFGEFVFPDGTEPQWDSLNWLQKHFMQWFNRERTKHLLTFPVETMNLLDDGEKFVDEEYADFTAEMWSKGHSFFLYRSDSVDSLSSCCRLRSAVNDNTFSFTLGAGGVATGSKKVITINVNRLVQNAARDGVDISDAMRDMVKRIHKYLMAYNHIYENYLKAHMLPIYEAGFIALEKQYLTVGLNGFIEGAEFLGIEPTPNDEYFAYAEKILKPIYEENRAARTDKVMFNTELIPAESLGVKNAKWDKRDGYKVPRDVYNSYFYRVECPDVSILDKIKLHGEKTTKYLDGGSALHMNLDEHLTKAQYRKLMDYAIKTKCPYLTFNIPNTICNSCGYISKHIFEKCPICGSEDHDYITRIIGYLKRVSSFSKARQAEAAKRYYHNSAEEFKQDNE